MKWIFNAAKVPETNQKEGWLDPRSKLNEKKSTIATQEAVVYYPLIDWKTKKTGVKTCVTPSWRHALEMIVQNEILLKASLDYSQNDLESNDILMKKDQRLSLIKWSKLDHPWWFTTQSLWGMGQLRKIITSCRIQWESNWIKNEWASSRGGATMQTSPCRVFRIPTRRFLICGNPNRVHGGRTRDVNKSNSVCRQSIIVSSESWSCTSCDSLSPG